MGSASSFLRITRLTVAAWVVLAFPSCFLDLMGRSSGHLIDSDGDGVPNYPDNCKEKENLAQADFNNNGVGDACELLCDDQEDSDGDTIRDVIDWGICPSGLPNLDCAALGGLDVDCGGAGEMNLGDYCDNCPLILNGDQGNADCDDVGDACEVHGNDDILRTRIVRDTSMEVRNRRMETFGSDFVLWDRVTGNFSSGEEANLLYDPSRGPGLLVAPSVYKDRLADVPNYAVMLMLSFPGKFPTNKKATAGVLLRVDYDAMENKVSSWFYCGLGKNADGESILVLEYCDGAESCESNVKFGLEEKLWEEEKEGGGLAEGEKVPLQLTGDPNDPDDQPPLFVLQAVKRRSQFFCYLRSRLYNHTDQSANVLGEVTTSVARMDESLIPGLRAIGVSTRFWAVAVFGGEG